MTSAETLELLCFEVEERLFAVDIMGIREILRDPVITPVPGAPDPMAGVFRLRGTLIPVVDLHRALLGRAPRTPPPEPKLVVVRAAGDTAGLLVGRVHDVVSVRVDELEPIPSRSGEGDGAVVAAFRRELEGRDNEVVLLARLGPLVAKDALERTEVGR